MACWTQRSELEAYFGLLAGYSSSVVLKIETKATCNILVKRESEGREIEGNDVLRKQVTAKDFQVSSIHRNSLLGLVMIACRGRGGW